MTTILVIQSPEYDFCQSTLIEGLISFVKKREDIQFKCTELSNYAKTDSWDYSCSEQEAINFGKLADVIVLCSNNGVKEYLVDQIDPEHKKIVYLDGEDTSWYKKDPKDFVLYFKREMLLEQIHPRNVYPFQFAAENRYFSSYNFDEIWNKKQLDVMCAFGPHDDTKSWRSIIENKLKEMNLTNSQIGSIYGNNKDIIDTGNRNHQNYYEKLRLSRISVDSYGSLACESGRKYESLANGCCLLTQKSRIHVSFELINNEHCIEYTPNNIQEKVQYLLDNPDKVKRVAENGFDFMLKHHTSARRAEFFSNICKSFIG